MIEDLLIESFREEQPTHTKSQTLLLTKTRNASFQENISLIKPRVEGFIDAFKKY
jgi:hypothetical protein